MNIITNYQAREITASNLAKRQEKHYKLMLEFYNRYKSFKKNIDAIFDGIRNNAKAGESVCFVDIKYQKFEDHVEFYDGLGKVLVDAFSYLGYTASSTSTKDGVSIWIEWQ
jgi:hypothetical protein